MAGLREAIYAHASCKQRPANVLARDGAQCAGRSTRQSGDLW